MRFGQVGRRGEGVRPVPPGRRQKADQRAASGGVIFIGFGVLAVIMIAFFASRAGLHVALHERGEAMGTVQVITAQISNNSFDTLQNVTVQFGDSNPVQSVGDMGPFSSVLVSPERDDYQFDRVTVTSNDGAVNVFRYR